MRDLFIKKLRLFGGLALVLLTIFSTTELFAQPCHYAVDGAGGDITITSWDFNNDPSKTQGYFLFDADGTTLIAYAESAAATSTGETFSVTPGNYVVYVVNYTTADFPHNGNTVDQYTISELQAFASAGSPCIQLSSALAFPVCSTDDLVLSVCASEDDTHQIVIEQSEPGSYNVSADYTHVYVAYDASGNFVASSTTGVFDGLPVGTYTIYAVNYNTASLTGDVSNYTLMELMDFESNNSSCLDDGGTCVSVSALAYDVDVNDCGGGLTCPTACTYFDNEDVIAEAQGANASADYTQGFFLINVSNGNVMDYQEGAANSFSSHNFGQLAAGNYYIYTVNYLTSDFPHNGNTIDQYTIAELEAFAASEDAPCLGITGACINVCESTVNCGTVDAGTVGNLNLCNNDNGTLATSGQFTSTGDANGTWSIDTPASIDANGNVDATSLPAGTYTVSYTVVNPDVGGLDCPDDVATATLTVENCISCATVDAGTIGDLTLCNLDNGTLATSGQFTSTGDANGSWSIDAPAAIDANGNVDATGLPAGTYTVTYTVVNPDVDGLDCPDDSATGTLTVESCSPCGEGCDFDEGDITVGAENQEQGAGYTQGFILVAIDDETILDYMEGDAATFSTATFANVSAGAYYVYAVSYLAADFPYNGSNFTDLTLAEIKALAADANGPCLEITESSCINVCPPTCADVPDAGSVASISLCNDPDGNLPTSGTFSSTVSGGTWSISGSASIGADGSVDALDLTPGTYTVTYTVDNPDISSGECQDGTTIATLFVESCGLTCESPNPGTISNITLCNAEGGSSPNMGQFTTSGQEGGSWNINGTGSTMNESVNIGSDGEVDASGFMPGTYIVTYTHFVDGLPDGTVCPNPFATGILTVENCEVDPDVCGTVSAGTVASLTLCNRTESTFPSSGVFASTVSGGTWTSNDISIGADGSVDALGLTPGTYTVNYTVENPNLDDGTICPDATIIAYLTVRDCPPPIPELGSIGNTVFNDENQNGVQDPGEEGIPGIVVSLYSADGTFITSTTTDADGNYLFTGLAAGDYYVVFDTSGYGISPQDAGDDNDDSDIDGNGQTGIISLGEGENITNVDAGLFVGDCEANRGSITIDKDIICYEQEFIVVDATGFNTSDEYAQVFVMTQGDDFTVVAVSTDGSFDNPETPGVYCIHPINYQLVDAPTFPNVGESATSLVGQDACYDFDPSTCLEFTILTEIMITSTPFCDPAVGGSYFAELIITGGFPEFVDFGNYNINYPPGFAVWDPELGYATITIGPIPHDARFAIDVDSDTNLCEGGPHIVSYDGPICPEPELCDPMAGTMATDPVYVCDGGTATVAASGQMLADDEAATYLLHNGTAEVIGEIVASSADGTFDLGDLSVNTSYYVVSVVGPAGDDFPNLEDTDCTAVSETGTPVVFLEPITIVDEAICNETNDQFNVIVQVTGGLPAYDGSDYAYTGSFTGLGDGSMIIGPIQAGNGYTISVADGAGCSASVVAETKDCKTGPTVVDLLSFDGEVLDDGNLLTWVTASEIDNDFFTILRSEDGINFYPVGTVDGQGTSTATHFYEFWDKDAGDGLIYYQLVQTDEDGTVTTFNVITLVRGEVHFGIVTVLPIPAKDYIQVALTSNDAAEIDLTLYDVVGKLALQRTVDISKGLSTVVIDISDLPIGAYVLRVDNGTEQETIKIVKEQ